MKRLILLFLFMFLFSIGVNGAGLSVDIETIDNLIVVDEEAIFDVTIKNEQTTSDQLTFLITDLNWDWEKKFYTIPPGMSRSFQLKIKAPKGVVDPDRYSLNLKIYSTLNNNVYVYEPLLVTVLDDSSLLELEKISYSLDGLNPEKESNLLKLIIKNKYDKSIEDIKISLKSDIFENLEEEVSFDEAELKNVDFLIRLNSGAFEGWHDVNVLLEKENVVFMDEIRKVKVGKHINVREDKELSNGFLIKRINIIKRI